MTLAEREARQAVPAAVRLLGHERHGLRVAMDRQVDNGRHVRGGKLLLCVWWPTVSAARSRRIDRQRADSPEMPLSGPR